ncbi:hypothetical protein DPMN_121993 [Dreissena polymorpha]|uniref:Uncharacterized protein n=1 Tax=Dreissena polymorpha TaxID=45954 RepID=A0A9D4JTP7_DREPO|nr:hypothetical protein DPMN_121993 [Dreissena polymorpha]
MDEDNARLMIKLTISGKLVSVSQYNTKLVSAEDYQKYSKYISKQSDEHANCCGFKMTCVIAIHWENRTFCMCLMFLHVLNVSACA